MKSKHAIALVAISSLLTPVVTFAADDADTDRSHPTAFVKDSVITTKIKTKLAAEKPSTLAKIQVDTDANGVVWLSGNAESQAAIDKAVSIARTTEGVKSVKNELKIKADD